MDTFSYKPDYASSVSCEPRVNKQSFGDGYEARWADGLNTTLEEWSVTFKRDRATAKAIYDWLKAKKALNSFAWTTPDGDTYAFVCDKVSKSFDEIDWGTVTATFRQVPEAIS